MQDCATESSKRSYRCGLIGSWLIFLTDMHDFFQVLKHAMMDGVYVDVEATDNSGKICNLSNMSIFKM